MSDFPDDPLVLSHTTEDLKPRYTFGFVGNTNRRLIIQKDPLTHVLSVFLLDDGVTRRLKVVEVFRVHFPQATDCGKAYIDTEGERIVVPAVSDPPERTFPYYGRERLYELTA